MFINRMSGAFLLRLFLSLHFLLSLFLRLLYMEPDLTKTVLYSNLIGHFHNYIVLVDGGVVDILVVKRNDGALLTAH